jgi:hypothetical protein
MWRAVSRTTPRRELSKFVIPRARHLPDVWRAVRLLPQAPPRERLAGVTDQEGRRQHLDDDRRRGRRRGRCRTSLSRAYASGRAMDSDYRYVWLVVVTVLLMVKSSAERWSRSRSPAQHAQYVQYRTRSSALCLCRRRSSWSRPPRSTVSVGGGRGSRPCARCARWIAFNDMFHHTTTVVSQHAVVRFRLSGAGPVSRPCARCAR